VFPAGFCRYSTIGVRQSLFDKLSMAKISAKFSKISPFEPFDSLSPRSFGSDNLSESDSFEATFSLILISSSNFISVILYPEAIYAKSFAS
jgi:hypothetical protein